MDAGQIVRERRLAHGLSQAQLARRAGTTQAALSRIEAGKTSPTVETFSRLLESLGEEAEVVVRRPETDYDRRHLADLKARPAAERLALAFSWNKLAGEVAQAGRRARAES